MFDFYARYEAIVDTDKFQQDQPVIGIVTLPFWSESMRSPDFQYDHFSWEHNINFVQYAGSHAIPIRYDLPDEELYPLLNQINGVYFTGGGINNIHESEYYRTARKILNYSME